MLMNMVQERLRVVFLDPAEFSLLLCTRRMRGLSDGMDSRWKEESLKEAAPLLGVTCGATGGSVWWGCPPLGGGVPWSVGS